LRFSDTSGERAMKQLFLMTISALAGGYLVWQKVQAFSKTCGLGPRHAKPQSLPVGLW
jgi:hypothetical protein